MGQTKSALNNRIISQIKSIAKEEGIEDDFLRERFIKGRVVIPSNKKRNIKKICGIGEGLRTKVNVNLGTSTDKPELSDELKKLNVAIRYGSDTIMDLSIGGDLKKIRNELLKRSPIPLGTVPIYEAAVNAQRKYGSFLKMKEDEILETIANQAKEGVDFFTIHSGITRENLNLVKRGKRILNIVSRGGAMLVSWMSHHKKENPLYKYFDEILDIAKEYDITLSLGDGMRPGAIADGSDEVQFGELSVLGDLTKIAQKKGVQVMIEGPGHIPLNQIQANVFLEKQLCHGAPFYVLGPLVTDIALGYDHISAAIGGALAASLGADFLCYVTPSEHLRHPTVPDVKEGLIASRIAAHSADLAKGIKSAHLLDKNMSLARRARDWQEQIRLSIDPDKARIYRNKSKPRTADVCTMCGKYCSIKLIEDCLN